MKFFALFVLCSLLAVCAGNPAEGCFPEKCKLPNCHCSNKEPPINGAIPQLVTISVDEAVTQSMWERFYIPVLYNKKNPDNCPISGTIFVPHEYTNYSIVNDLYNHGFEIGSLSITKNYSSEYWKNATQSLIQSEMEGQRKIISKFANIPIDRIISSRIPNFQLNGDETYLGLKKGGFLIDSSWTTHSSNDTRFFPYTLDFLSTQQCLIGTCPTASIPGFWIVPIIDWRSQADSDCNKLQACDIRGSAEEISDWMVSNFMKSYKNKREPFKILVNSAVFDQYKNTMEALKMFLDYLGKQKDVFLVSEKQVVDWMKNPVTADKYKSCVNKPPAAACVPRNCLFKLNDSTRYMSSCVECPKQYPWLNNPYGDK